MNKYMGILIICIVLIIGGIGISTRLSAPNTYTLYSLSNSTQINGSFFLGCGTINEKPVYYFYRNSAKYNNGKVLDYVRADYAMVYEDLKEKQIPYLIVNKWSGFTDFHVPPNSISQTFNLDVSKITQ